MKQYEYEFAAGIVALKFDIIVNMAPKTNKPHDPDEQLLDFFTDNPDEAAILLRQRAENLGKTRPMTPGKAGEEAMRRREQEANQNRRIADIIDPQSPDKKG